MLLPLTQVRLRPNHAALVMYRIYQEMFTYSCVRDVHARSCLGPYLFDCPCRALKASQIFFFFNPIRQLAVMLKPCVALRSSGHCEACR